MRTFYKYTTNFGADFFKNPTLKISIPTYLNDPFESETGDNLVQVLVNYFTAQGREESQHEIKEIVNQLLKSNGIFSVSETPRNPLMWAHYADEHRGLCIGYNENLFNNAKRPEGVIYKTAEYKPVKVNYDSYRFDRQTEINEVNGLTKAIKTHLLTKSDDWIYEKEHRCIIPFSCASYFIIDRNNKNQYSKIRDKIHIDAFLKLMIEKHQIVKISDDKYSIKEDADELTTIGFSSFGCVVFIYEVDPKHITNIYAGLRVTDPELTEIYNVINKKEHNLSHIKLHRFKLSTKRFELLPDLVDEEYIASIEINK